LQVQKHDSRRKFPAGQPAPAGSGPPPSVPADPPPPRGCPPHPAPVSQTAGL